LTFAGLVVEVLIFRTRPFLETFTITNICIKKLLVGTDFLHFALASAHASIKICYLWGLTGRTTCACLFVKNNLTGWAGLAFANTGLIVEILLVRANWARFALACAVRFALLSRLAFWDAIPIAALFSRVAIARLAVQTRNNLIALTFLT
jgi:hypothetical protein